MGNLSQEQSAPRRLTRMSRWAGPACLSIGLVALGMALGLGLGGPPNGAEGQEKKPVALPPGWIDVKAHGAKGDKATDDTRALQSAVDQAGGGTVFLPPGTYRI